MIELNSSNIVRFIPTKDNLYFLKFGFKGLFFNLNEGVESNNFILSSYLNELEVGNNNE